MPVLFMFYLLFNDCSLLQRLYIVKRKIIVSDEFRLYSVKRKIVTSDEFRLCSVKRNIIANDEFRKT